MCSRAPYSQYATYNQQFYAQPCSEASNTDPYNNLRNYSYQQLWQLDRHSLMPASWSNTQVVAEGQQCGAQGSDWYKYAPTCDGFNRYITATGASRIRQITRNPLGRIVGAPNLLRTAPVVPVTTATPWFNNSGARSDLVQSLGCSSSC